MQRKRNITSLSSIEQLHNGMEFPDGLTRKGLRVMEPIFIQILKHGVAAFLWLFGYPENVSLAIFWSAELSSWEKGRCWGGNVCLRWKCLFGAPSGCLWNLKRVSLEVCSLYFQRKHWENLIFYRSYFWWIILKLSRHSGEDNCFSETTWRWG